MTATAAHGLDLVVLRRLLSLGFAPPSGATLAEVEDLAVALAERPGAPEALGDLLDALAAERDSLAGTYNALFGGEVAFSPYEGSFEADPFRQARQMADVAGFYRAFGAEADGPVADRVDHAGTELEFLSFVGAWRLAALEEGKLDEADRCREIEDLFLAEHAGRWLPTFCDELASAPSAFYAALGRLGAAVLRDELAERGIEPQPLGPRRTRLAVEADTIECVAGSGMSAPGVPEPDAPAYLRPRGGKRRGPLD